MVVYKPVTKVQAPAVGTGIPKNPMPKPTGPTPPSINHKPAYDKTGGTSPAQPQAPQAGASQAVASIDGRQDRPTALARWYATVISITGNIATVELDDDSNGASTITIPCENVTPTAGQRVVVDFREDGLAVVTSATT